jgi:hypothetical protein
MPTAQAPETASRAAAPCTRVAVLQRCCPTWTWCWPRPTSPSPAATPNWSRTPALRDTIFGASHRARRPRSTPCSRSPASAELLDANPLLKRSIRNRFPYIDPLNHLQVELLRRYRERRPTSASARHPHDDQRHRRGAAQQRMISIPRAGALQRLISPLMSRTMPRTTFDASFCAVSRRPGLAATTVTSISRGSLRWPRESSTTSTYR